MVEKLVVEVGCFGRKRRKKKVWSWCYSGCCCWNGGGDVGGNGGGNGDENVGVGGQKNTQTMAGLLLPFGLWKWRKKKENWKREGKKGLYIRESYNYYKLAIIVQMRLVSHSVSRPASANCPDAGMKPTSQRKTRESLLAEETKRHGWLDLSWFWRTLTLNAEWRESMH